jgi:eukaryotic-like serine/threonine-protein kinase
VATDRWERMRHLFDAVCDLPASERAHRLSQLSDDPALCAEVETLVAAQTAGLQLAAQPMGRMLDTLVESELREGDRLGAWLLVQRLGGGGMGAVFRAERDDGKFQQRAAIKLLRGIPSAHGDSLLQRERQILARLEHPGIARLFDGGETPGGLPYLVMEYIDGERVNDFCSKRQLGLRQRLILLLQVADALAYAHRRLVLHCDLKPSNVMVRDSGQPVLLDFGVARLLDQPGAIGGGALTPGYAAPEQLAGEVLGVAADVYGLGRLLAELLVDRRLLGLECTPPLHPAQLARAGLPWRGALRGDIDLIVATATARDPADRYPSVEAFAADVRSYLDGQPLGIRGRDPLYRLGNLLQRRAPWILAMALALLIGGLAGWRVVDERNRAWMASAEANVQAQVATEISEFLVALFEGPLHSAHNGNDAGIHQILDLGRERLLADSDMQPQARARLIHALSGIYQAIGLREQQAEMLRLALALQPSGRSGSGDRIAALSALVAVNVEVSRLEEAEQHAIEARQLLSAMPRPDPLLESELSHSEALLRRAQGRLPEARALLMGVLEVHREHFGERSLEVAAVLHDLGLLAQARDDATAARGYFRDALDIKRALVGERHPSYQMTLDALSSTTGPRGEGSVH